MNVSPIQPHYFDCECGIPDHIIRFVQEKATKEFEPALYLEVQLNKYKSFFSRIWTAIKYIFNCNTDSHWDTVIIKPSDYQKIIDLIQVSKQENDDYMKKENPNVEFKQHETCPAKDICSESKFCLKGTPSTMVPFPFIPLYITGDDPKYICSLKGW
jgi:hypothetical protein